ncbi:MAG: hypothetical protein EP330_28065 [Deltaproteobacteria bacterium]|nr:MAG: hypothetical protein EP330_28065 [Deltaproteobacteria bacterium]
MDRASQVRQALLSLTLLLALGLLAMVQADTDDLPFGPAFTRFHQVSPIEGSRVLVILDNVRADRLALCGADRPTSSVLESLVAKGARHRCDAIAPGSWTLPSHASFFTGLPVHEHGAHAMVGGTRMADTAQIARPLSDDVTTLAERMRTAGFQTVLVTANPVLSEEAGLLRGFDRVERATHFGDFRGEAAVRAVRRSLRGGLEPNKPLFLVVNLVDAHWPWPEIPADVGWVPPRPGFEFTPWAQDSEWARWHRGELDGSERERFLAKVRDLYDYGIAVADRTLGDVLRVTEDHGWLDERAVVVVTSDHGEMLGEHDRIDHGHLLWQGNQEVPFVAWGPGVPELPERLSALAAHALLLGEAMPEAPHVAIALPHVQRSKWAGGAAYTETTAAMWDGSDKLLWIDGESTRFDLMADPKETSPMPADEHPLYDELQRLGETARESGRGEVDGDLGEALKAIGYAADD